MAANTVWTRVDWLLSLGSKSFCGQTGGTWSAGLRFVEAYHELLCCLLKSGSPREKGAIQHPTAYHCSFQFLKRHAGICWLEVGAGCKG